ncbi:MAG: type II toxin-antitoxin system VapC family toxin [Candidatus Jacksonbacteria bacterium]|nr:type II toxin-antitoxin system VapC family toxin [Candidatus Jacksonbacteria bacterium]
MRITFGEKYLVDTNVLIYALNKSSLFHAGSREILETQNKGAYFVVAQQNLVELTAVLTKQFKVPLKEATDTAHIISQNFEIITSVHDTWETFTRLVEKQNKRVAPFDLFLAATMLGNGVERIITANGADFKNIGLREIVDVAQ